MTEHDESGERRRCYSLQEHVETLLDMLGLPHEVVDNERCEALQTAVYALKKRADAAEAEIARLREALDERDEAFDCFDCGRPIVNTCQRCDGTVDAFRERDSLRAALAEREKEPTAEEWYAALSEHADGFINAANEVDDVVITARRFAAERVAKATDVGADVRCGPAGPHSASGVVPARGPRGVPEGGETQKGPICVP